MQRRRQKIVEESGAEFVNSKLRDRIASFARKLIARSGYNSIATVEFLVSDNELFFWKSIPGCK